jgi:hypothetical protein
LFYEIETGKSSINIIDYYSSILPDWCWLQFLFFILNPKKSMNNTFTRICLLLVLLFVLGSWGEKAHQKINASCVKYFPSEMKAFRAWGPQLGAHGSDADNRKNDDRNEFVRHFIDMDNYDQFLQQKTIDQDFQAECRQQGRAFVMKNGTLPWVTDSTYRALVNNMRQGQWEKAMLTAADLGHYVGDGHMPLHLTANYNGQLSDQKGIHARYEIEMIDRYINGVELKKAPVKRISQVQPAVFNYLYHNYRYMAPLLEADKKAYQQAGHQYNDGYYASLWKDTGKFTTRLLREASQELASLIYSAWVEAGKPQIPIAGSHKGKRKLEKIGK